MTEAANIPKDLTDSYTTAKWAKTLQCITVRFEFTPDEIIRLAERLGKAEAEVRVLREQIERLCIALEFFWFNDSDSELFKEWAERVLRIADEKIAGGEVTSPCWQEILTASRPEEKHERITRSNEATD